MTFSKQSIEELIPDYLKSLIRVDEEVDYGVKSFRLITKGGIMFSYIILPNDFTIMSLRMNTWEEYSKKLALFLRSHIRKNKQTGKFEIIPI
ncbi:MAG: hypothetical protein ACXABG_12780 [Promethearchaeota archaeon]|jgi:hypothetical protein